MGMGLYGGFRGLPLLPSSSLVKLYLADQVVTKILKTIGIMGIRQGIIYLSKLNDL